MTPTVKDPFYAHRPLAAVITRVWSGDCVNLAVFAPDGVLHPATSVPLVPPGTEAPAEGCYCRWPPRT